MKALNYIFNTYRSLKTAESSGEVTDSGGQTGEAGQCVFYSSKSACYVTIQLE